MLSLLLKLPPRKLVPWFVLWSFFLLRLLYITINLPYGRIWNTVFMCGLVLLVATWNRWISYKNRYTGLLPLHLLPLEPLAHRRNVASLSLYLFIYLFIYLLYFRFIYRWQILFHLTIRLAFYKQQGLSQTSGAINNIAECCYPWHQIFETTSVCGAN